MFLNEPGFLEPPANGWKSAEPTGRPGQMIDRYKLIELIGEGGMGEVWAAEQTEPVTRRVALKLIKAGKDSRQVLARFNAERNALARMDHPNIAKILDAGVTPNSLPYFVMELVQGQSITRFCDEQRLSPRQRLQLFIPVCHAIQHAHQKGILHRDIKPGNVLIAQVDGRPQPKVIDFGVAKAIDVDLADVSLQTQFGMVVGTPQYMSPEQADPKNHDVDTRTDVYSLGVLLYELLTGSPPFDQSTLAKAGVFEMLRIIREVEPRTPSTKLSNADALPSIAANRNIEPRRLTTLLRGDLDWIVMKSLEKERVRRYETANGLARDIERYLNDEPVEAGPPGTGYRFQKFLRRNRGPVIAAALLMVSLIAGIIGTSIGLYRAEQGQKAAIKERQLADQQRDRAERHYQRALSAVDRLLSRVGAERLAAVPHMDETRRRLLEDALEFYRGFLSDESHDPVVRREIGRAHGRIGQIQESLGRPDQAEQASQKAIEILGVLVAEHPENVDCRFDLLETQRHLAQVWQQLGRSQEAEQLIRDILSRESGDSHRARNVLSGLQYLLGIICYHTRRPAEAEKAFQASLELDEILARDDPANQEHDVGRANCLNMLGLICRETQRLTEAENYYRKAKDVFDRLVAGKNVQPDHRFRLAGVLNNLGLISAAQDRSAEAEKFHRESIEISSRLVQDHPDLPEYRRYLASSHNNLGLLYAKVGDQRRAMEENDKSLKVHEELMRRYPKRIEYTVNVAAACGNHAKYLIEQDQWAQSITWNSKAIDTLTSVIGTDPRDLNARLTLFNSLIGRAAAYRKLNQQPLAIEDYRRAVQLSEGERHATFVRIRPRALAFTGEHARAAAEAEAIASSSEIPGSTCRELASVFAQCSALARSDHQIPEAERETLAERYAVRAVSLLAKAGEKGNFKYADQVAALGADDRLQSLQPREDFKKLLTELEAKVKQPDQPSEKQP